MQLFTALSEALNNHVRQVTAEKKQLVAEAQNIITTVRQMEASLGDHHSRLAQQDENDGLDVSYPLTRCIKDLKEKHAQIARAHRERFEQVKSMPARPDRTLTRTHQ